MTRRSRFRFALLLVVIVAVFSAVPRLPPSPRPAEAQQADSAALETIALINQYRLQQGLTPLKLNATLTALADAQAAYLADIPYTRWPSDIHRDASGRDIKTRAQQAGWAVYNAANIAVTEIGRLDRDPAAALAWWQGSSIHNRALTNAAYREIGAAVLPASGGGGDVFMVVLGGRPHVLPAVVDPAAGLLYLTRDQFGFRQVAGVVEAAEYRLYDAAGQPLQSAWQPWAGTVPLPAAARELITVAYRDEAGTGFGVTTVDLDRDWLLIPATLDQVAALTDTASAAAAAPTTAPTAAPTSASAAPPTATPTRSPTIEPTAVAQAGPPVAVIIRGSSLVLANVSEVSQDWGPLRLVQGDRELRATSWQGLLPFSLISVPPGGCAQLYDRAAYPSGAALPEACSGSYGELWAGVAGHFWLTGAYEIWYDATLLATCPAGAGTCAANLPG